MSKHTPTPWDHHKATVRIGKPGDRKENGEPNWGGFELRHCPNPEADARHIVKCVNAHDWLVKALRDVKHGLESKLVGSPEFTLESMIEGVDRVLAELDAKQ